MLKKLLALSFIAVFAQLFVSEYVEAQRLGRDRGLRHPLLMRRMEARTRHLLIKAGLLLKMDNPDYETLKKTLHEGVRANIIGQALRLAKRYPLAAAFYLRARVHAREVIKACKGKLDKDDEDTDEEKDMAKGVTDSDMEKAEKELAPRLEFPRIEDFMNDKNFGLGEEKEEKEEKKEK